VAPSFIRVGQLELFGRRARKNEHPQALEELEKIVLHLIDREYSAVIDHALAMQDKVVALAQEFRSRLTSLVANWIRVGYCQGNFNSDNCAAGGYTLDYGPFGFCDVFNPRFQPWTGGGDHYAFLNQPVAAEANFHMFCVALRPLLAEHPHCLQKLNEISEGFAAAMQAEMEKIWAAKLGLDKFNPPLFRDLAELMMQAPVDYTLFFRELSAVPDDIGPLKKSFYKSPAYEANPEGLNERWSAWLARWQALVSINNSENTATVRNRDELSSQMKRVNPKYSLREWHLVPAYEQAATGDYGLLRELQDVMTQPYTEQSQHIEDKYYRLKPLELFGVGGASHYSCSS
jgi:uncharacterized protein YdiU (UPF0061 family)